MSDNRNVVIDIKAASNEPKHKSAEESCADCLSKNTSHNSRPSKPERLTYQPVYGEHKTYPTSIDSRGRLYIPDIVQKKLGKAFYVTLSTNDCLLAYSSDYWQQILSRVDIMPIKKHSRMRPFFRSARICELDNLGYVNIPKKLKDYGRLTSSVIIVDYENAHEIWDSKNWDAYVAEKELSKSEDSILIPYNLLPP